MVQLLEYTTVSLYRGVVHPQKQYVLQVINGTVAGQTNRGFPKPALGIQWQQTADKILLIKGLNSKQFPHLYDCQLVASRNLGLLL